MRVLLIVLGMFLFISACRENETKFDESDYTSVIGAEQNKISLGQSSGGENFFLQLLAKGKKEKLRSARNQDLLYYRFFVDEDGSVDEIKILHNDGLVLNVDTDNISLMKKWKFALGGEKTKYQFDFIFTEKEIAEDDYLKIAVDDKTQTNKYPDEVSTFPKIIGGVESLAKLITYPKEAKESGVEGKVFLRVFVSKTGDVEKIMVVRGIGAGCDIAALSAVCRIKFTPATVDGEPVSVQVAIPIAFRLDEK